MFATKYRGKHVPNPNPNAYPSPNPNPNPTPNPNPKNKPYPNTNTSPKPTLSLIFDWTSFRANICLPDKLYIKQIRKNVCLQPLSYSK